ncbi:MAG: VWA domain-containing protein [Polyangiaceae bacterium]
MHRFVSRMGLLLSLSAAVTLTGCSEVGGGDMGATPGGVKDMTFARTLVEAGRVPPASALLVEAMFAEHDLPLSGAPCTEALCLKSAIGRAPTLEGEAHAWAQIGLSSGVDSDTFVRPATSFIATVDVSGSMGWGGQGSPGEIARKLLSQITGKLGGNDRVSIVTYGSSVDLELDWVPGNDPGIPTVIAGLSENGSTNMEAGLERAFQLGEAEAAKGRETRVLLFTDEQPNVGATDPGSFEDLVRDAASHRVGLTVFGLGLGLGAELMQDMAHLRGGNAFSLAEDADVDPFIAENWPWFTVPVAYDLEVHSKPTSGVSVIAGYGFPGGADGPAQSLEVASVFLSKSRGGLLLELGGEFKPDSGVDFDLTYLGPNDQAHAVTVSTRIGSAPLDARGVSMPELGVSRATSLAIFVSAMHEAAALYATQPGAAAALLDGALERLHADADASKDADLSAEFTFWTKLAALMHQGAPQGDLYGE